MAIFSGTVIHFPFLKIHTPRKQQMSEDSDKDDYERLEKTHTENMLVRKSD